MSPQNYLPRTPPLPWLAPPSPMPLESPISKTAKKRVLVPAPEAPSRKRRREKVVLDSEDEEGAEKEGREKKKKGEGEKREKTWRQAIRLQKVWKT